MASLTRALTEFVETEYARRLCDECNVQPMIGAPRHERIGIMFESVRLQETKLVVRLHQRFEIRSMKLLEHLVRHLKASMPGKLQRLEYHSKSPPSTRTIII